MFISPEDLRLPQYVKNESLEPTHQIYKETADLEAELPHLDVLYMTRIQQERFFNEEEYLRLKGCYQLDEALLQKAPQDMPVLHPLPRIDEIKKRMWMTTRVPPTLIKCTMVCISAWPSFWRCLISLIQLPAKGAGSMI